MNPRRHPFQSAYSDFFHNVRGYSGLLSTCMELHKKRALARAADSQLSSDETPGIAAAPPAIPFCGNSDCAEDFFDAFSLPQVPFYIEGKSRAKSNDLFRGFPSYASRVVTGLEICRTRLDATPDLSDLAAISVWSRLSLPGVS